MDIFLFIKNNDIIMSRRNIGGYFILSLALIILSTTMAIAQTEEIPIDQFSTLEEDINFHGENLVWFVPENADDEYNVENLRAIAK